MFARSVLLAGAATVAACLVSTTISAAEANAQRDAWLAQGLPPLIEPGREAPYVITSLTLERNHVDQQTLRGTCERKWLIRTVPASVKIVILPANGGRYADEVLVGVNGPQASDRFGGVVGRLLDWQGKMPGGARVYLEMQAASPVQEQPAVRISEPYWYGTDQELAAAMKAKPPVVDPQASPSPPTVAVEPAVALPKGTPVLVQTGERQSPGVVHENAESEAAPTVLLYLARPGGLFKPYLMEIERDRLEIEAAALEAITAKSPAIGANFREYDRRLSAGEAPKRLEPAATRKTAEGTRLVGFTLMGMESFVAMGPAADDVVRVKPASGGEPLEKRAKDLYLDPEPDAPSVAQTTPPIRPSEATPADLTKPAAKEPVALAEDYPIEKGNRYQAKWAGQWYAVEVVEVLKEGKVKIHWIGYTDAWDQEVPRTELFRLDEAPPAQE